MNRFAIVLLGFLLGTPAAGAIHQGVFDINALDLNVVLHHPFPDEKGDPWGLQVAEVNGSRADWMAAYYGAFYYPTAVFDGVMVFEATPEGEGGGAYQETYANYRAVLDVRRNESTPYRLLLDGDVKDQLLDANVTVESDAAFDEPGLVLRIVLFEDDVPYDGGNGILHHRFVVRDMETSIPINATPDRPFHHATSFALAEDWSSERVGFVAYVQNAAEASPRFAFKEVLQSATWRADQSGPTVQVAKGVLLELYSATWCVACVYADSAADNLANEFGPESQRIRDTRFTYLRETSAVTLGVGLLLAVGVVVAATRYMRPRGGAP